MKLYYFSPDEFVRMNVNWYSRMSPRLLVLLDTFRHLTGPCIISPHSHAIGRHEGTSQHNINLHGEVRAVDVFPDMSADIWIKVAYQVGFTGIGIYPHWTYNGEQRCGMHLDVREDREPGNPSTWSGVKENGVQVYKSLDEGLGHLD